MLLLYLVLHQQSSRISDSKNKDKGGEDAEIVRDLESVEQGIQAGQPSPLAR